MKNIILLKNVLLKMSKRINIKILMCTKQWLNYKKLFLKIKDLKF